MNGKELKELRKDRGLTQTQLAELTGIPLGTIGRLEASGDDIKKIDLLGKIADLFKIETSSSLANYGSAKLEAKPIRLADPEGLFATADRFYELADHTIIMQTPVIPYKAYASYLRGHSDPEFYEGLETIPIPVDKNHKGSYLIFEIGGESMVDYRTAEMARKSIWPGQKVIGRDLRREHWKYKLHINSTECWIIVHREKGIVLKEIIAHDVEKGLITLHSWNPDKEEHPDYTVSLDDVSQIFNVVDPYGKL